MASTFSCYNDAIFVQVYSKIGHDVIRVRLWDTSSDKDIFINKLLVEEGYAEKMEEPYQSKVKNLYTSHIIIQNLTVEDYCYLSKLRVYCIIISS